ncbi:hypothetical protein F5884DRAFT_251349 [Xylogone sp. PMI_703]|nr:hypothetical protein F5884DRAFT_251349 [Xylogone sp. PMI_703]
MFNNQGVVEAHSGFSPLCLAGSDIQLKSIPVGRRPACQTCRERHVKCNGLTPCSRCTLDALECIYARSRQGERRLTKTQLRHSVPVDRPLINCQNRRDMLSSVTPSLTETSEVELLTPSPDSPFALPTHEAALNNADWRDQQWRGGLMFIYSPLTPMTNSSFQSPSSFSLQSRLISASIYVDAYFRFFHHTHPVLLPRRRFERRLSEGSVPYHLECAVIFNSSFFISSIATGSCGDTLDNLFNEYTPQDGYTVQAMLLFGIGLHANGLYQESTKFLRMAGDLALELGMHRKEYATDHGEGDPVLEESWRRTWWEIYVLDGILAGVCPIHHFDLYDRESDVPLPCEESEYDSEQIPCSRLLSDLDNAVFSSEDWEFSSFAYRIDAIRTLGKILKVQNTDSPDKIQVDQADTMLVNWILHLPSSKREFTSRDGHVDEMLLQAHMIANFCAIVLHSPYSDLILPPGVITACTPYLRTNKDQPSNKHTARTLHAAASISKQVRHLTDMRYHSHFLACVVTLATLIHLASWTGLGLDNEVARQSIRLNIGIMKLFAQVWPIAEVVLAQIKNVASVIKRQSSIA